MEAAHAFANRLSYIHAVLDRHAPMPPPAGVWHTTTASVVWAIVTLVGSVALGFRSTVCDRLPTPITRALTRAFAPLRAADSGQIGDYVAWLTFDVAVTGGLFAVTIR